MRRTRPHTAMLVVLIHALASMVALASCGEVDPAAPVSGASGSSTSSPEVTEQAASDTSAYGMSAEDAEAVRDLAFAYREAYNAYDADTAVSYLDDAYRPHVEEAIRSEIGRIKAFGVQLGVTEQSAPELTSPDEAEVYLTMKEPIGTRTMLMKFARGDGGWIIVFAEEVKWGRTTAVTTPTFSWRLGSLIRGRASLYDAPAS